MGAYNQSREHAEAPRVLLRQQLRAASLLTCAHPLGWPGFRPFTLPGPACLFTGWKLGLCLSTRAADAVVTIRSGGKMNRVGRLSGQWRSSWETFIAGNPFRSPTQIDSLYWKLLSTQTALGLERRGRQILFVFIQFMLLF